MKINKLRNVLKRTKAKWWIVKHEKWGQTSSGEPSSVSNCFGDGGLIPATSIGSNVTLRFRVDVGFGVAINSSDDFRGGCFGFSSTISIGFDVSATSASPSSSDISTSRPGRRRTSRSSKTTLMWRAFKTSSLSTASFLKLSAILLSQRLHL